MTRMRSKTAAVFATGLVLLATGCAGEGSDGGDGGGAAAGEITVGVLPLSDFAPVYWAQDHGTFKDQGLTVKFEPVQGGPVGVQEVVTGELQFTNSTPIASVIATAGGAPVQTVAMVSGFGEGELGVFAKAASGIEEMADLDRKTVGINTTSDVGDVIFAHVAQAKGIDPKPDWVEVPFAEMIDGVKNGSIAARYLPEPFGTAAVDAGLRRVVNLVEGEDVGMPMSTFIASTQYASSHPETVQSFAHALNAARDDIAAHPDEFKKWLSGAIDSKPEEVEKMHLPVFDVVLDPKDIQNAADLLAGLGIIGPGYDAAKFTVVNEK